MQQSRLNYITSLMAFSLFFFSAYASAHEIWLERDGATVNVFVGDIGGELDQGEVLKALVPSSHLFVDNEEQNIPVTAVNDHLIGSISTEGDVRFYQDQLWQPWVQNDGAYMAAVFQARAGRSETHAFFTYELVPIAANSNTFTLLFEGNPMAGKQVTVVNPALWKKSFTTDNQGRITVPTDTRGQYVLIANHEAPASMEIAGKSVVELQHIATLSFVTE